MSESDMAMKSMQILKWIKQGFTVMAVLSLPLLASANEFLEYNLQVFVDKFNQGASRMRIEKSAAEIPNHAAVKVEMTEAGPRYVLQFDPVALNEPKLLVPPMTFIVQSGKGSGLAYSLLELQYNADRGSKGAKAELRMLETLYSTNPTSRSIVVGSLHLQNLTAELDAQDDRIRAQLDDVKAQALAARADMDARERRMQKKRSASKALDAIEAQEHKLNDLILRNDRAGVARMLESYLPWEMMEPFEAATWKNWIQAIEFPNMKASEVMIRGVDYSTDKVQRLKMADGSERVGFFSTILTKNQGSYTRRLRSLTTNRVKNGDSTFHATTLLMQQLARHAGDPRASNFISFTSAPDVAIGFVGRSDNSTKSAGGLLAARIDKRRLLPNIMSNYQQEVEYLAPLIVFPDEVVVYREATDFKTMTVDQFEQEVRLKSGVTLQRRHKDSVDQFQKAGVQSFKLLLEQNQESAGLCSKIFM